MISPKFGDRVCWNAVLRRTKRWDVQRTTFLHYWEPLPLQSDDWVRGLFLGSRTLSNGYVVGYESGGVEYTPDKDGYTKVALVCEGPRRNPIYVPWDAVRLGDGQTDYDKERPEDD